MNETVITPLTPLTFLERCGRFYANQTAVIDDNKSYTFKQLLQRCKAAASYLNVKKNIKQGSSVAVLSHNSLAVIEAHFFVPATGAQLVSINPALGTDEIIYQLKVVDAKTLIISRQQLKTRAKDFTDWLENSGAFIFIVEKQWDGHLDHTNFSPEDYRCLVSYGGSLDAIDQHIQNEHSEIAINFTSGTTGNPKGVVFSHRSAYLQAMGQCLLMKLDRHSRYLWTLPMFHGNGWFHIWANLAVGAIQVLLREEEVESGTYNLGEYIVQNNISHSCGSPRLMSRLLEESKNKKWNGLTIMVGGAAPPPDLILGMEEAGISFIQQYGLNESCATFSVTEKNDNWQALNNEEKVRNLSRQGVPAAHVGYGLRVVDAEGKDVIENGVSIGEIWLQGNTIFKGYYKNLKANNEAFINGWFKTGDLAVLHENRVIELKDRIKDQVLVETSSGWLNVSTLEVERVLSRCPSVTDIAVMALKLTENSNDNKLVAFIELDAKTTPLDALTAYCNRHLNDFQKPVYFIQHPIPKTATGKVKKHLLKKKSLNWLLDTHKKYIHKPLYAVNEQ